jgi:hypothetical protein
MDRLYRRPRVFEGKTRGGHRQTGGLLFFR